MGDCILHETTLRSGLASSQPVSSSWLVILPSDIVISEPENDVDGGRSGSKFGLSSSTFLLFFLVLHADVCDPDTLRLAVDWLDTSAGKIVMMLFRFKLE